MSNAQRLVALVFGLLGLIGVILVVSRILNVFPKADNGFVVAALPCSIAMAITLFLILIASISFVATIACMFEAWRTLGKMNGR